VDATGAQQSVLVPRGKLPYMRMEHWSHDGRSMIYRSPGTPDPWQVVAGSSEARRLTQAREPVEQVRSSPDGRWIAYNSDESGRTEVYVSPIPWNGRRSQVSIAGGAQPAWRADGRELYYLGLDGGLYAVGIRLEEDQLQSGRPSLLFRTPVPVVSSTIEQYRVTEDGQRFVFCVPLSSIQRDPLTVVLNWPAKLSAAR
jgi:hypothetical protein